jgi:HTH-type transcriptional regulator/antitoxin HigA
MIAASKLTRRRVDPKKYGRLLASALPRVIKTEAENERMLAAVWQLMKKGDKRLSPEEMELLEVLSALIERFEEDHYPIPDAPPHEVLRTLMEDRGLRQKDLLPIFGSAGTISDVVNGKRSVSKAQAEKLAAFFHVSVGVFI